MAKFIIVVGGVYSGTGKGIAAASIGLLLKLRGSNVQLIKCDPYLNINAGTMSPHQHGEVFLCNDGSETDLDLGHYERITGIEMSCKNILTNGALFKELIQSEESGKYLGETVQIVPHVTDKIQEKLKKLGNECDIVIAEIGGTVGDIESGCFYEAIRQFKQTYSDDVLLVMIAPIIWNETVKEFKTKPLQNSVKTLQSYGLQPDMLLCRVNKDLPEDILKKVARLTNVPRDAVFDAPDVKAIYEVPIAFWDRHIDDIIADKFHLKRNGCRIRKYRDLVEKLSLCNDKPINIGIVGKYDNCDEAYQSLKEALTHAAANCLRRYQITWINAEDLENKDFKSLRKFFEGLNGLIVPGGFDARGVEGKIKAIQYVRENKIPFLGICLGLQCAVIEFARNIVGINGATSEEFNKNADHKLIHFIEGQSEITKKCGTMRLGAFDCELSKSSLTYDLYQKKLISERHRHRYEVNDWYEKELDAKGLHVVGRNPQTNLIEFMELDQKLHPFFIGTQAHPEFKSTLSGPAPLFSGLLKAAATHQEASI